MSGRILAVAMLLAGAAPSFGGDLSEIFKGLRPGPPPQGAPETRPEEAERPREKGGWQVVAELPAGGPAKEVAVNRDVRVIQIECTEGSVIVNTLVVREGPAKNPITVARRFNQGERQDVDLGGERQVSGLRISDGGRGKYRVRVK